MLWLCATVKFFYDEKIYEANLKIRHNKEHAFIPLTRNNCNDLHMLKHDISDAAAAKVSKFS